MFWQQKSLALTSERCFVLIFFGPTSWILLKQIIVIPVLMQITEVFVEKGIHKNKIVDPVKTHLMTEKA